MQQRNKALSQLSAQSFDVLIVGGGINGAVSAAALAAKGVKVALIDQGDFAGVTSSNSSNLAWGGIKYLESHEYLLVNKLCLSRNLLMQSYPSTVKEIRFLTSIQKGFRFSPQFIYLGALFYWFVGRFFTKRPHFLRPKEIKAREPHINIQKVCGGIEYSDAYLFDNDARFVFGFIRSALDHGCIAANYIKLLSMERRDDEWIASVEDVEEGGDFTIRANIVINACGSSVDTVNHQINERTEHHHVFSKGVHLIVDRISENDRVLAFFASDGRLFFVIPMGRKTCIGTTDTRTKNPNEPVSDEDRQFILDNANSLLELEKPLTVNDIIAERCGVRPLVVKGSVEQDDWLALSRKHEIEINEDRKLISIFGGKLTDCLNVGEEVSQWVKHLGVELERRAVWYGEPGIEVKQRFFKRANDINLDALTWSESSEPLSQRFWRRYGAGAFFMLDAIERDASAADLLIENAEYTRCEIEYARDTEMITKLEDFLRRRSKISLVLRKEELIQSQGLRHACEIFFADKAQEKLDEYVSSIK